MGSASGDSVASQSHCSHSTITGLTGLSGSETGFGLRPPPVNKACTSRIVDVGENIDPEDIPLALLVPHEKLKKMNQKSFADPCKLSRKVRPNPIFRSGSGEGRWVFTKEMLQRLA